MTAIVVGVDDDRRVLESIESLIASAGHVTLLFSSAEAFLESGTLIVASCLIADLRMSGMDGIELQRCVRVERPELPVIIISAHYDDDVRRRALAGGAVEFLYKPLDPVNLLATVERALKEHQTGGLRRKPPRME
jgi:FixJ family two-component response regulator